MNSAITAAPLGASPHHILPIALELAGFALINGLHVLPAFLATDMAPEAAFEQRVAEISFHIAARVIQLLEYGKVPEIAPDHLKAPVSIFLSHAKVDLIANFTTILYVILALCLMNFLTIIGTTYSRLQPARTLKMQLTPLYGIAL